MKRKIIRVVTFAVTALILALPAVAAYADSDFWN